MYMVKDDYDKYAGNGPVRGIMHKDCERVCETCNHIKSQHNTVGGFCKHCTCVKFNSRRTKHAPDAGVSTVKMGYLTPEEDAAIKADNTPTQRK